MWDTKHIIMAIVAPLVLLALGAVMFVWPTYRHAAQLRAEATELRQKVESLEEVNARVQDLAGRYSALQHEMDAELKIIPEDAAVERLMRRLSLPVDAKTVVDQTFTTGSANPAIAGDEYADVAAMPLNVEMESNFDSVFALIRSAESMERLVRISTVRIQCDRSGEHLDINGHPMLTATVGLEAIYRTLPVEEAP